MKNLILKTSLLVYLLSMFVCLQAQNAKLPPLQLQKGDTFSYEWVSSGERQVYSPPSTLKTEQNWWLTFTVSDVKDSVYSMKLQIDRLVLNNKYNNLDTQDGYHTEFESPLLRVPIPFKITNNRKIIDLHLPEDIIKERKKDFAGDDLFKSIKLTRYYQQQEANLKTIIEGIFTHWDYYNATTNTLNYKKSNKPHNYYFQHHFITDTTILANKIATKPHTEHLNNKNIKGEVVLNPNNSLPNEVSLSMVSSLRISSDSINVKNNIKIRSYAKQNDSIHIRVNVDEDHTNAHMELFTFDFIFDNDLINWETNIEGGKSYIHSQLLSRPTALTFLVNPCHSNIPFSTSNLLVEPGDSITIHLTRDNGVIFTGKGAFKNTIKFHILWSPLNIPKQASINEAKHIYTQKTSELLEYLEPYRNQLSDWAYQQLSADIYFGNLNQLMGYYDPNIYSLDEKNYARTNVSNFSLLFGTIEWDKYASITSYEMRKFISNYLFWKAMKVKNDKHDNWVSEYEKYYLAELVLSGKTKYIAQSQIVWNGFQKNDTKISNQLFNAYKEKYWQSEFYNRLNKLYTSRINLGANQPFPDVTFSTIDGKQISTNDLKGKYVQILFVDTDDRWEMETLNTYQEFKAKTNDKNFELITVFVTPDEKKIKDYVQTHNLEGILVSNPDWCIEELKQFYTLYNPPHFLVNPDAIIIQSGGVTPLEHFLKEVKQLIKQTDFSAYEASISQRTLYSVLWVALLAIAIIIMVSIVVTRNIKRKETMQRQKLEWQISAVRSQLNPHFLFNAMNSIQFLVNQNENKKANLFLSSFAKLMRKVLYQAEEEFTSLENELDTIQKYLELEQLRHKFTFHIEVDPAIDLYNTEIPVMLIQPFVENAILHGIAELKDMGRIEISIKQVNQNQLKICISDNGVGLSDKVNQSSTQSNGKGMHLTQKRMDLIMQKYRKEITFEVNDRKQQDASTNGTLVNINIETEA